jgi:hypothetical protein
MVCLGECVPPNRWGLATIRLGNDLDLDFAVARTGVPEADPHGPAFVAEWTRGRGLVLAPKDGAGG